MTKAPPKTGGSGSETTSGLLPSLLQPSLLQPSMFAIDAMLNGNGRGLAAWTEMSRTLLDRLGDWQAGTTRFVTRRLEEELAAQRRLAACRTPSEAAEVCSAFTRQAVRDYTEEAGRVTGIADEMVRAGAAFGGSLTTSAAEAARSGGTQGPTPLSAAAKATDDSRAEIAA